MIYDAVSRRSMRQQSNRPSNRVLLFFSLVVVTTCSTFNFVAAVRCPRRSTSERTITNTHLHNLLCSLATDADAARETTIVGKHAQTHSTSRRPLQRMEMHTHPRLCLRAHHNKVMPLYNIYACVPEVCISNRPNDICSLRKCYLL